MSNQEHNRGRVRGRNVALLWLVAAICSAGFAIATVWLLLASNLQLEAKMAMGHMSFGGAE